MISSYFKNKIADFIDKQATKADVVINGVNYTVPIRRSIVSGSVVRKHIYLTKNDPVGTVTRARLLDANNNVLDQRTDTQYHEKPGKAYYWKFKYTVQEEERNE